MTVNSASALTFFRQRRRELLWIIAGFIAMQLALGVLIETRLDRVRDPVFEQQFARLKNRVAETPERALYLILGSSRSKHALNAAQLCDSRRLVFNFSISGTGPLAQLIYLRRLLAAD